MEKDINIANINTDIRGVIKLWLKFTRPAHKMTDQEQDVLSSFLYHFIKFRDEIKEETVAWKMTFDYDTRLQVKLETGIKDYTLQNILTRLRKKGILTSDNRIKRNYIPNISLGSKKYTLTYNFNITNG